MSQLRLSPLVFPLALLLGACSGTVPPATPYAGGRPQVTEMAVAHAVWFQPSDAILSATEAHRIEALLNDPGFAGSPVWIDRPAGDTGLDRGRGLAVANWLTAHGVAVTGARVGDVAPDTVRLTLVRVTASAPGCPDWRRDPSQDPSNALAAGFGCATAHNLAAMIAKPADLARGSKPAPAWAPQPGTTGTASTGAAPMPTTASGGG